jgi:ribosomal protein S18 acetylase RimI-like enzyme
VKSCDLIICHALSESQTGQLHSRFQNEWWSAGRSFADVRVMLQNSDFIFGIVATESQELLAFARILTDRVFKAVIFDVIVHPARRHASLGTLLMAHLFEHPELANVRHFELYCLPERAGLYQQDGFTAELGELLFLRRSNQLKPL